MTLDLFLMLRAEDHPDVETLHHFGRDARVLVKDGTLPVEQSYLEWGETFVGWVEARQPEFNLFMARERGRRMRTALADLGQQARAKRAGKD